MDYKERSEQKIKWADEMGDNCVILETLVAMKTPVMEAEHVLDERNKFSFYNCLIPMLKEHRRFKLLPDSEFSIEDFKTQQKVR